MKCRDRALPPPAKATPQMLTVASEESGKSRKPHTQLESPTCKGLTLEPLPAASPEHVCRKRGSEAERAETYTKAF